MKAFLVLLLAVSCFATPFNPARARSLVKQVQRFTAQAKGASLSFPHKLQDDFGSTCDFNAFAMAASGSGLLTAMEDCQFDDDGGDVDFALSELCKGGCVRAMNRLLKLARKYDCNIFDMPECANKDECFPGELCINQKCVKDCTADPNACFWGEECVASDKDPSVSICKDPDEIQLDTERAWATTMYMLSDLMCSRNENGDYCMELASNTSIDLGVSTGYECEALYDMGCCLPTFLNFSIYCMDSLIGPALDFGELISWENMTAECPDLDYKTPCRGVGSAEYCCTEGVVCGGAAALTAPLALVAVLLAFLFH